MNNINSINILNQKKKSSILVIGEAMLDIYLHGDSKRICREAPVPIVDIRKTIHQPGGAANTAVNLSHLGVKTHYISVMGNDEDGKVLKGLLKANGVTIGSIFLEKDRKTIIKQRVMASDQLLMRIDSGSTTTISEAIEEKIINTLVDLYPKIDAVIISDYGYGIITPRIIDAFARLQKHMPKILVVDSKYPDRFISLHPTMIKPNYQEAISLLTLKNMPAFGKRMAAISSYGEALHKKTGADIIALTVDVEGSIIFEKGKSPYRTFTKPVQNSRAAGAGDTYTSAFTLALTLGAQAQTAAEIASAASSVVVQKDGTATCTKEELQMYFTTQTKKIPRDILPMLVSHLREEDKKIVFTNGCFDILHSGHVDYLSRAKQLGDLLIVGLNSDKSIKRLKGRERPVNTLSERIQVLSGLGSVDYIIPFETDTPIPLIKKIHPDIYVKGSDYRKDMLPEAKVVESYRGRVELLPFIKDKSTTNIIKRIQAAAFME